MTQIDAKFVGSMPEFYDHHLSALFFQPYADDLADRLSDFTADTLLETARSTGLQVTYHLSGSTEGLSTSLQLALFRLVQEGITNTLKHARRATRLQISIRRGQEDLRVVVDDNGGSGLPTPPLGHGLLGMRERVALHNGRLFAGPTSNGWRVSVWLPLHNRVRT